MMEYGKNARVGNITVFSREGAIRAFKLFFERFTRDMTMEASIVVSDAMTDMLALGFTPEEVEEIELSTIREL